MVSPTNHSQTRCHQLTTSNHDVSKQPQPSTFTRTDHHQLSFLQLTPTILSPCLNPCLLSLASALASALASSASALAIGSKEVVQSITFYTTFRHGAHFVTFGPKSDAKTTVFHTTFGHGSILVTLGRKSGASHLTFFLRSLHGEKMGIFVFRDVDFEGKT